MISPLAPNSPRDCPVAADNTGRPDRPENITAAAHNDLNAPSLAADADTARSKEDQTPVLPEQGHAGGPAATQAQ